MLREIEASLPGLSRSQAKVAEWVLETLESSIRMATGSLMTQASFGPRWLSNLIRNIVRIETRPQFTISDKPIIAAASGPTLDRHLEGILAVRNDVEIWALPSSVGALRRASITPDLVITTDPGYYASYHYRGIKTSSPGVVAAPLTATPGFDVLSDGVMVLDQGSLLEREIYRKVDIHRLSVPMNGTVAGTLYELSNLRPRPLIFAGLDLCVSGEAEHAKPHPFDLELLESSDRLHPADSSRLQRLLDLYPVRIDDHHRTNMPLKTYAAWFSDQTHRPRSVFRLLPTDVDIRGMKPISIDELAVACQTRSAQTHSVLDLPGRTVDPDERLDSAAVLLEKWINKLETLRDRSHVFDQRGIDEFLKSTEGLLLSTLAMRLLLGARKSWFLGDTNTFTREIIRATEQALLFLASLVESLGR